MKLEDICCSLELAKELKEIGVKQESLFSCFVDKETGKYYVRNTNEYYLLHDKDAFNCYSAFTASELLNMLPYEVHFNNYKDYREFTLEIIKTDEHIYKIQYFNAIHESAVIIRGGILSILSNMIIYLIENKLVSVEEINERI